MCVSLSTTGQNFIAKYEITEFKEQVYSKNLSLEKIEMNKSNFKELKNFGEGFELEVICNSNNYFFDIPEKLNTDNYSNPYLRLLYLGYLGLDESFFHDKLHHYYTNNLESFITKSSNDILKWQIQDTMVNISGYNCYVAKPIIDKGSKLEKTVKDLKVWFTNEISLKGGPTRYGNLPGLIIALENNYVKFELLKLEETNKNIPTIDQFADGKTINSSEETDAHYKKLSENLINN